MERVLKGADLEEELSPVDSADAAIRVHAAVVTEAISFEEFKARLDEAAEKDLDHAFLGISLDRNYSIAEQLWLQVCNGLSYASVCSFIA